MPRPLSAIVSYLAQVWEPLAGGRNREIGLRTKAGHAAGIEDHLKGCGIKRETSKGEASGWYGS